MSDGNRQVRGGARVRLNELMQPTLAYSLKHSSTLSCYGFKHLRYLDRKYVIVGIHKLFTLVRDSVSKNGSSNIYNRYIY
jgi:hypothetical protein